MEEMGVSTRVSQHSTWESGNASLWVCGQGGYRGCGQGLQVCGERVSCEALVRGLSKGCGCVDGGTQFQGFWGMDRGGLC